MVNDRRLRWAVLATALALLAIAIVAFTPASPVAATLGPVIAVTPNEVDGATCCMENPSISRRGEGITGLDWEYSDNHWAQLDRIDPEAPLESAGTPRGITVSGDGCVALWAEYVFIANTGSTAIYNTVYRITDRCPPTVIGKEVYRTFEDRNNDSQMALSYDGRFAAIEAYPDDLDGANAVLRIDTSAANPEASAIAMPRPTSQTCCSHLRWRGELGLDISDDGNVIAATSEYRYIEPIFTDIYAWDFSTGELMLVSGPLGEGTAAFPSVSRDGRYIAFTSSKRLTGETTNEFGPWVYVADRTTANAWRRISPEASPAYHSTITADGSQVAYVLGEACEYDDDEFDEIEYSCPGLEVRVAYGPTPGLTGAFDTETVIGALTSAIHYQPVISGNGRWVAWITDNTYFKSSNAGTLVPGVEGIHIYTRRRDPGLAVDAIDFGTNPANSNAAIASATIRNTGPTSLQLETFVASPGAFTVVGGGTCVGGALLPPGATCTVNVRFTAPNVDGTTTGTLTVSETGHDALTETGQLVGRSVLPTTTTSTTTTTTTTLPTQIPPPPTTRPRATTTTSTTTIPGNVSLQADPAPLDFGQVPFGISSPIKTLTVTNTGTTAGTILTELAGTNPADFFVAVNNCNETTLAPGASCTMDIMMIAQAGGNRSAELILTAGGASGSVDLLGQARFLPRLLATPGAITTNGLTTIVGQGFPPGQTFTVNIGGTDQTLTGTADTTGLFRIPYSAFNKLELGSYQLTVDALPDSIRPRPRPTRRRAPHLPTTRTRRTRLRRTHLRRHPHRHTRMSRTTDCSILIESSHGLRATMRAAARALATGLAESEQA